MVEVVNKYKINETENDFYIGRGSALGNPYTSKDLNKTKAQFQCKTREESINKYREYIIKKINDKDKLVCNELNKIYKLAKKTNVRLICFCKPNDCHGDVIKEIIEEKINNNEKM